MKPSNDKDAYTKFKETLASHLPEKQIYTELAVRFAYGTDASCYRYIPEIVVRAQNEREVLSIIKCADELKIPITFRASGTSLSGQTSSNSVLVLLGDDFVHSKIIDNGAKIKLRPMVIGSNANFLLKPFGRKIGPDPATINTARIGGIAANNSSGMCCGTKDNSYHTLDTMRVVLADGTILDTSDASSIASFRKTHADFLASIQNLANIIKSNPELETKIRHKYRLKNTTGYGINALVDFEDPLDMLTHLMIGSEGTLGFISEITYKTVVDHPHKASALVYFDSLDDCCNAVTALRQRATVDSVELLDALTVRCVGGHITQDLPSFFYRDIPDDSGCLLIETKAENDHVLDQQIDFINGLLEEYQITEHSTFSKDTVVTDFYWSARKGLLPIIGGNRPLGSNLLTEDVAVPIENLALGVRELTKLLFAHGYQEAAIMGHALEGNLHFILTPSLTSEKEIKRYDDFMQALSELIAVKFGGSLKAEHGTGRNIAPFVKVEWGEDAYGIMRQVKDIFDPKGILNPDVIITDDPTLHLKNLKSMPEADPLIDQCIECGLCEPACPSDGLSLTPRQRIVLWRQHEELVRTGDNPELLASIQKVYPYMGIDTCAMTGMCQTRCPIGINTGTMIKSLIAENRMPKLASFAESHIGGLTKVARGLTSATHMVGAKTSASLTKKLHGTFKGIPVLPIALPKSSKLIEPPAIEGNKDCVVYFVSCVNRTYAEGTAEKQSVAEHTLALFKKAGFQAVFPENFNELCCGQPFDSLKETLASEKSANRVNDALLKASENGKHPIYMDNSPCALRLKEAQAEGLIDGNLKLYDAATFLAEHILPKLTITKRCEKLSLHIPCSATKMQLDKALTKLAGACTESLSFTEIACCGFAGNKGMFAPELNANGLRLLKNNIPEGCNHGVSMSRTCQIGLTEYSGIEYQSIEALLNQCSQ